MRINWFSNAPWVSTGYGNQTKLFVPRLQAAGHQMSITAFFGLQGGRANLGEIPIYPTFRHPYGQDVMQAHAAQERADVVLSLLDIWVVGAQLSTPWYPWFPIDHEPMPANVLASLRRATKGITMSKFGQRMAEQVGVETYYVPHGVDTGKFQPVGVSREVLRKRLGLPVDAFVVGMVAANKGNPPRKAFFEQIAAFAALKQQHGDAVLYLHTDDGSHGGEVVNLLGYLARMGLRPGVDVFFVDQYMYGLGLPDEYMVDMYCALDVLSMVSMGEGFGIPLIEAQACGCPVITGEWTSMGELCFGGWKLSKSEAAPTYHDYFDAFQWTPSVGAIAERMLAAYEVRGNQEYRARARAGAARYDAERVTEKYWLPTLRDIESHLVPQLAGQP